MSSIDRPVTTEKCPGCGGRLVVGGHDNVLICVKKDCAVKDITMSIRR